MTVPPHNPDGPWAGFRRDRANIAGDWRRALGPLRTEEQVRRDLAAADPGPFDCGRPYCDLARLRIEHGHRDYWTQSRHLGSKPLIPQDHNDTDDLSPNLPWPFVAAIMLAAALAILGTAGLVTLAAMLGWLG